MKKQLAIWQLIRDSLETQTPAMLLYVLESSGSSPGRQGFFMAVNAQGKLEGSIGGGIMEHKFVEMAKGKLQEPNSKSQVRKQYHDKSAAKNQSGMICSGEQTILIYQVQPKDLHTVYNIINTIKENKIGALSISPGGLSFSHSLIEKNYLYQYNTDEDWLYKENIGYKNHLYIVGGGHCALAFSKLMSQMDFYIHLFEVREELHTLMQNDFVHEKKIVQDYSELKELIPSGDNHYGVVMTLGYRTDDIALRALLGKEFKYFGVLGSKSKIDKMFEEYRQEGISEDILSTIHAPVGIQIKSETPEEIAVSIAAEIIQVKNLQINRKTDKR